MSDRSFHERSELFAEQRDLFIEKVLNLFEIKSLSSLTPISSRNPHPLQPHLIGDYHNITLEQRRSLREDYFSEMGVAYYLVLNPHEETAPTKHPIFEIADQLRDDLNLHNPLSHPLEGHDEAVARFGPQDGTVKVYNLPKTNESYREQGETAELFSLHTDGLGSGGTVQTTALYMDSPSFAGGYTFFQNILLLSLELARDDPEAFRSLFLPDALTQIRPRGKGALKVTGPVLFLNETANPQASFRTSSGEYLVEWRRDFPALDRAMGFLNQYAEPFSRGSSFVHFTARGHGCFIRNQVVAHGRTAFVDGPIATQKRLLSRKWFMVSERDAIYKHIPGLFILKEYAELIPELFAPRFLVGEWSYDSSNDANTRIR